MTPFFPLSIYYTFILHIMFSKPDYRNGSTRVQYVQVREELLRTFLPGIIIIINLLLLLLLYNFLTLVKRTQRVSDQAGRGV